MKLRTISSSTSILGSLVVIVGSLAFAALAPTAVEAADACQRKDYKTEMVRDACAKGGQKAAKDAMKAFNKANKIKSCNQCHSKLAPTYALKPDGLEQFKKLGGKLIADASSGSKAATKIAPKDPTPTPAK